MLKCVRHGSNDPNKTTNHEACIEVDAMAELDVRALRYPLPWEFLSPNDPTHADWRWHNACLDRLRTLGVAPIAGLLHRGHPAQLAQELPDRLARHAEQVATRHPWITMFTPVNEPLATARFSGLSGGGYPHGRDVSVFLHMLVTQCRAIVLAMRAIRRITPEAKLVQTENLGKVFCTPPLNYQAEYENERRWLGFDLLCGRIDHHHPWQPTLLDTGIDDRELGFFLEAPCIPDIVGIDHDTASERFLDHRVNRYPIRHRTSNMRHRYANVDAMRAELPLGQTGPEARLREVWERYHLPMAVTETRHSTTPEEPLHGPAEVWDSALNLKAEGMDIRAVTVWSVCAQAGAPR